MEQDSNKNIWVIVIILLLIIGTSTYFYLATVKNINQTPPPLNQTPLTLTLLAYDEDSKERISISYQLFEGNSTIPLEQGFMLKNSLTEFKGAKHNTTYRFILYQDDDIQPDYIAKETHCTTKQKDTDCYFYNKREGNPSLSSLVIDNKTLILWIYNPYGEVHQPTLCFGLYGNINSFNTKEKITPPVPLKTKYDFCIYEPTLNPRESRIIPIDFEGTGTVNILLRDYCKTRDTDSCGMTDVNYSTTIS